MVRFVEALFLLVVYFSSTSEGKRGSCWRYGHSCWGGHGKRAGAPPIIIPDTRTTLPSTAPLREENGSEKDWDLVGGSSGIQYRYQAGDIPISGLSLGYNYYTGVAPLSENGDDDIVTVKMGGGNKKRGGRDFFSYLIQSSGESSPLLDSAETPDGRFGKVGERRLGANQDVYGNLLRLGMKLRPPPGEEWLPAVSIAIAEEEQNNREAPASSISPGSSLRNNWSLYKQRLLRHGK